MNRHAESKTASEAQGLNGTEARELRELQRRLSFAPSNTELRLHLAQWLAGRGRRREALEELRALVHLEPNHLVARKLREELLRQESEPAAGGEPPLTKALH